MKLTCALVSCNRNPLYFDFWPLVKHAWNEIVGIKAKCILIADEKPPGFEDDEDIILFPSFDDLSDVFISQCIRLLYPALLEEEGVIISDMDVIPTCRWWYQDTVKSYPKDSFITYRMVMERHQEVPLCYNAASSKVWGELFDIKSLDDVKLKLKKWWDDIFYDGQHDRIGWNKDKKLLWNYLHSYFSEEKNEKWIRLKDYQTYFQRLDRSLPNLIHWNLTGALVNQIINHNFTDYHMLRPQSIYKKQNNNIYNFLLINVSI